MASNKVLELRHVFGGNLKSRHGPLKGRRPGPPRATSTNSSAMHAAEQRRGCRYSSASTTPLSAPVANAARSRQRSCPFGESDDGSSRQQDVATHSRPLAWKLKSHKIRETWISRDKSEVTRPPVRTHEAGISCPTDQSTGPIFEPPAHDRDRHWQLHQAGGPAQSPTPRDATRRRPQTAIAMAPVPQSARYRSAAMEPSARTGARVESDFSADLLRRKGRPPSSFSSDADPPHASGPLRRIKQPSMLEDGVAVRHPGDVVGHGPGASGGAEFALQDCARTPDARVASGSRR